MATRLKSQQNGKEAVFITVCRNLPSMLNVQLKAAMLPRSPGCATIKRTTWLDAFGSTRFRILRSLRQYWRFKPDIFIRAQLIYLTRQ